MSALKSIEKFAPSILAAIGSIGVIVTAVLTAKDTPKAMEAVKKAQQEKGEEKLTFKETIKTEAKNYIPAIATGIASIACIVASNKISRSQQAALAASLAALYSKNKEKVNKTFEKFHDTYMKQKEEEQTNKEVPWDEKNTYHLQLDFDDDEETVKDFIFEATPHEIADYEYLCNRCMVGNEYLSVNDMLTIFKLNAINEEKCNEFGWNLYIGEIDYGYKWIDWEELSEVLPDGRTVTRIRPIAGCASGPHSMVLDENLSGISMDSISS